jgi:hypothetical protein
MEEAFNWPAAFAVVGGAFALAWVVVAIIKS